MDAGGWLQNELIDRVGGTYSALILGGVLCIGVVVIFLILAAIARSLFRGRGPQEIKQKSLEENLAEYPELVKSSGDRQLRAEGVPVRLRLLIVAPAGTGSDVNIDELPELLDMIVLGMGDIYKYDKPRVQVWPVQISYQGFGNVFHRNMRTGGEEGQLTRWVLVAGRAKVGKKQLMLGMALQSAKPNTIGRRTIDTHEWASILRVRVKD
jgi:hypothetical protein